MAKEVILREQQKACLLEMSFIPTTIGEFKNSKHYTLPSILKKYQGLSPNAQPIIEGSTSDINLFLSYHISHMQTHDTGNPDDDIL